MVTRAAWNVLPLLPCPGLHPVSQGNIAPRASDGCLLGFLVRFSGTADRKFGVAGAGVSGFVLPRRAKDETRSLYADKVVRIRWQKGFGAGQDCGPHFDNERAVFIRDHVAPLLVVVE